MPVVIQMLQGKKNLIKEPQDPPPVPRYDETYCVFAIKLINTLQVFLTFNFVLTVVTIAMQAYVYAKKSDCFHMRFVIVTISMTKFTSSIIFTIIYYSYQIMEWLSIVFVILIESGFSPERLNYFYMNDN